MARRPPPVTLPQFGQKEGKATAEAAIKRFRATGYRASAAPTPERILRAGGDARVETFSEVVEIAKGDKFEPTPIDMVRLRISDDVLGRLCTRKQIDKDVTHNLALCTAGIRYRCAFQRISVGAVKSIEMDRVACNTGTGMFSSEVQTQAFQQYARMKQAVPPDFRVAVDGIVLDDRDPTDVGRKISGYAAPVQAKVIALWGLKRGLASMARVLGLIEPEPTPSRCA